MILDVPLHVETLTEAGVAVVRGGSVLGLERQPLLYLNRIPVFYLLDQIINLNTTILNKTNFLA